MRRDSQIGIQDYLKNKADSNNIGVGRLQMFVQSNYRDTINIVCKLGKPSLFLTFRANPNQTKITSVLDNDLINADDRPNLICRVFEQKRKEFMKDILKKQIFGKKTIIKLRHTNLISEMTNDKR